MESLLLSISGITGVDDLLLDRKRTCRPFSIVLSLSSLEDMISLSCCCLKFFRFIAFSKAKVLLGLVLYEYWCLQCLPSSFKFFLVGPMAGFVVVAAMLLSSLQMSGRLPVVGCYRRKPGGWLLSPQARWVGFYNYVQINNLCAVTILPVQMIIARR